MIIYKPTGQIFQNRKEAKIYFGTSKYRKIEEKKDELIFTSNIVATDYELQKNNRNDR